MRRERAQEPPELEDFEDTISSALEDTQRGLRALDPRRTHTPEYLSFQQQVIHAQTEELRILRAELAKVVAALNFKASKKSVEKIGADVTASLDKRLDSIRNWSALALTLLGLLVAAARVMK